MTFFAVIGGGGLLVDKVSRAHKRRSEDSYESAAAIIECCGT